MIRIGARVTMTTLLGDERIRRWFPALLEAAAVVGSIQIRNRATLVGNVCNASPPPTRMPVLLVHGAVANIAGPSGDRRVPLSEFFVGRWPDGAAAHEVVASLDLPIPAGSAGAAFGRLIRRRGVDLAIINLCVLLEAGRPRSWRSAPLPQRRSWVSTRPELSAARENGLMPPMRRSVHADVDAADQRRSWWARLPGGDAAGARSACMAARERLARASERLGA